MDGREDYVPAFGLPREPVVLTRGERAVLALIVLVVIAQLTAGLVALVTAGQAQDPAMDPGETSVDAGEVADEDA